MEKQVPARARIFSMNIPALRRDEKEADRDLKPEGGRERWGSEEGRNRVKFKSERQSNKNSERSVLGLHS